jgi:hypothetical protein
MSGNEKEFETKVTRFRMAGMETTSGRLRVEKAYKEFCAACHDSHLALVELVDFLISPSFEGLIKEFAHDFKERTASAEEHGIHPVIQQYMAVLEKARNIRERTSNIGEELHRASIDMPSRQLNEPRRLVR